MDFAAFGCALDALDAPEKVAMKLAFLEALVEGRISGPLARDPYDLMGRYLKDVPGIRPVGRLELESWLTPRPDPSDVERVTPESYRQFLDSGGCADISARLGRFVSEDVLPSKPLLIGVDHSLTGAVLIEMLAMTGPGGLFVVVLDTHLDALPASVRVAASEFGEEGEGPGLDVLPETYTCGSWLRAVMEGGAVGPGDVAVVGVSDHPGREARPGESPGVSAYREEYLALEDGGLTVVPKREIREGGIEAAVERALAGARGRPVYVSIDADVASGPDVGAVRFMDTIGLTPDEVVDLARALGRGIADTGGSLAGLDVMEIDIHLADIPGGSDRTAETMATVVKELIDTAALV